MLLIPVFAIISLITFILYGVDKRRSKRDKWRIPERVLIGFSLLGGGVGGWLGMKLFRHKTRHWYFHLINILGTALQVAALLLAFGIIKIQLYGLG